MALTVALATTEFKVRYFGSVLGYLWQLLRPLMLFGILYVVFTQFVKFNEGVEFFPAVLLTSIVLYTFFSDATSTAVTSLLDRENLLRKIQFPRVVVPLATVLTALFNMLINLVAVAVFVVAVGVRPHWTWLLFPLVGGAGHPGGRHVDAALVALRPLPRREADLGGDPAAAVLRIADPLRDRGHPERRRARV